MRKMLDSLYRFSGGVAAIFLFLILLMIAIQMVARWSGIVVAGLTDIAGYCMAATSFFGLGYAMNNNSHIRVELVLSGMKADRRVAEIICTAVASLIAAAFVWFAIKANYTSFVLGERSQGQDEIFIWIPQITMSVGTLVLLIALLDRLYACIALPDSIIVKTQVNI
jgi:TRAP-type C4-dicarboxylate transport system permease small subunit